MAFDTKVDGVTQETQQIIDDFLSHYKTPNTHGGLIKKMPDELGISDFKQLTYEHYQLLMNKYQGSSTNSKHINSLFKYLYSIDILEDKHKFVLEYGSVKNSKKHFEDLKAQKAQVNKKGIVEKKEEPVLSFSQIEKLIEYCNNVGQVVDFSSYKKLRMAFAFYALFFEGISRDSLMNMNMGDYSDGEVIIDDEYIEVPEKYQSMFEFAMERGKYDKYIHLNKYIKTLGEVVGIEKLMPKDVTMARKDYLFSCPACGKYSLSFEENWKIVNGKIVCCECALDMSAKSVKKNIISELDKVEVNIISDDEKEKIIQFTLSYEELKRGLKRPCDFEEWNKYLKQIGDLGEKYVYEREVNKLIEANRLDLAEKVDYTIADDYKNGYDILSYTIDGREIHIEVKTTPGELTSPFYISRNELEKAKQFIDNNEIYEIHRVYNAGKDSIAVQIYRDISLLKLEDAVYKATIQED